MSSYLVSLILALAFMLVGLVTLHDYGISWDGPTHMLRGQAYVDRLLFKDSKNDSAPISPILINPFESISRYHSNATELGDNKPKLSERPLPQLDYNQGLGSGRLSFYRADSWAKEFSSEDTGHPAFADNVSAFFNRFFWGIFGLFGDIQSYQVFYILISSIGIFVVSRFAYELTGSYFAAVISALSLALFPIFFAESHFNTKDTIQASFFAGCVWAFWHWVKEFKLRWGIISGLFFVFALGVKWNIVVLPFILGPWLFFVRKTGQFKKWFNPKLLMVYCLLLIVSIILFLVLISPAGWSDPFKQIFGVLSYYFIQGTNPDQLQPPGFIILGGFNIYPLLLVLFQTPEAVLVLALLGVLGLFKNFKDDLKSTYLLLFWILLPLLRVSIPHTYFYSGLRQIMEIIPAIAVLAGVGAGYLVQSSKFKVQKYQLKFKTFSFMPVHILLGILFFIVMTIPVVRLHPNENAYFNLLAGGLKGAAQKNLIDWTLAGGNIYKQAADFINKNAEANANVAFMSGNQFALSPLYLRDDVSISPNHFSAFEQKGEYIMVPYGEYNPAVFAARFPERFLKPVHMISVDSFPLLYIYKNEPKYAKESLQDQKTLDDFKFSWINWEYGDYLLISLGKRVRVTGIKIITTKTGCIDGDNEFVRFREKAGVSEFNYDDYPLQRRNLFIENEKKSSAGAFVEYLFPAEIAEGIEIHPTSSNSCFSNGKVLEISYFE